VFVERLAQSCYNDPVPGGRSRARSGGSAKAQLLTVLGELVLPHGGRAWTRSLVDALGLLGIEERNARQAAARTADQGFIAGEKVGRRVRWVLTPEGRELLTTGTRRIYDFGVAAATWDGQWLVVLCPVPEDQRGKRQHLRRRLEFAGFGFLSATVALSPHVDRQHLALDVLKRLELVDTAVVFRAEEVALPARGALWQRAWDLDGLAAQYRAFEHDVRSRTPRSTTEQTAALLALVHAWRRFPFEDPEIPDELLPRRWPGHASKALFDECHARWSPAAVAWFLERERASG
jgi:phenylacetic acid degradation operon negative regulatory protein